MVQIRLSQLKTGDLYNPKVFYVGANLTNLQKMELVRCRIWGNTIGDNFKSGSKRLRKDLGKLRSQLYEQTLSNDIIPYVDDFDHFMQKKIELNDRRSRILLRGTKIGQRKVGAGIGRMSIFDTKKAAH